uniref:Uncharacterized protein LOC111115052 n=1 Tax=Crassostrea virginica TaxID=6565 RepID=A0A8B8C184_CRAVI|nr:uncharacterized protein LOC111115052 [Crassostrea virginica]
MDSYICTENMDDWQRISESVFMGLCRNIGTSEQVLMRREIIDISDKLHILKSEKKVPCQMKNGSNKEGFRFEDSDIDHMVWFPDNIVIWERSQTQFYNLQRRTMILSDGSESPPGYTLLCWLPLERANNDRVQMAIVRKHGRLIVSSFKYRTYTCPTDSYPHGPCATSFVSGLSFDVAHCFVSDFWPPSASSWKSRCHFWPKPHVVNDIIRKGCHLVAVGPKLEDHMDNEWRISFSVAEQLLVRSLNHSQFLVYGLLKLLLKEVLNKGLSEDQTILCSYHLKTAVFWVVQLHPTLDWGLQNFLQCFWVCFKIILKWVYEGFCPNFFIPENNVFLSKVYGGAQHDLFIRLHGLYEKGLIDCLMHISSISQYVRNVQCNPNLTICTDEKTLISEKGFESDVFFEVMNVTYDHLETDRCIRRCMKTLRIIEQMVQSPLTQYKVVTLQKVTSIVLQSAAFILHNQQPNISVNKERYVADRNFCFMLKLAAKFGCVTDRLYIAMYHYRMQRYQKALDVIEIFKYKTSILKFRNLTNIEMGTENAQEKTYSKKMADYFWIVTPLVNTICYMEELRLEQFCSKLNGRGLLYIPAYVLLHMLEFLCYRHVDPMKTREALGNLQLEVGFNQENFSLRNARDISWEILGLCKQMTGNVRAALFCYQQSLAQNQYNKIQTVTEERISCINEGPQNLWA